MFLQVRYDTKNRAGMVASMLKLQDFIMSDKVCDTASKLDTSPLLEDSVCVRRA
jgi:hypothetical protein